MSDQHYTVIVLYYRLNVIGRLTEQLVQLEPIKNDIY